MAGAIGFATLAGAARPALVGSPSDGDVTAVPARYRALFQELQQELDAGRKDVAALPDGDGHPSMAPALFTASSAFASSLPGTPRWKDIVTMLDGFKSLGAGAVSVMISFPDLCREFHDPGPVLEFYAALSHAVHARGMKLLVEQFVYPPFLPVPASQFVAAIKRLPDPEKAYLDWDTQEAELIVSRIHPDYFSVVTEPGTCDRFLGIHIAASDYARWLKGLLADLSTLDPEHRTRIGAGAGAWDPPQYVDAFARIRGLDYIDFHFYPLKLGDQDYTATLLAEMNRVKAEDPSKKLVMSEVWLYKHGADEAGGVFDPAAYGRDRYGFWTPLDQRFLALMAEIGRKEDVSVIAPYFSQFFFYSAAFDPVRRPSWPACMMREWTRAAAAAQAGQTTPLGRDFRSLNAPTSGGAKAPLKR